MTNREFVEHHWEEVHPANMFIFLGAYTDGNAVSSWAEAAEFTRERLEEIRQLEREVATAQLAAGDIRLSLGMRGADARIPRALHVICRIQDRLESILSDLRKGMKEPA